jgi:hypothetical protein
MHLSKLSYGKVYEAFVDVFNTGKEYEAFVDGFISGKEYETCVDACINGKEYAFGFINGKEYETFFDACIHGKEYAFVDALSMPFQRNIQALPGQTGQERQRQISITTSRRPVTILSAWVTRRLSSKPPSRALRRRSSHPRQLGGVVELLQHRKRGLQHNRQG